MDDSRDSDMRTCIARPGGSPQQSPRRQISSGAVAASLGCPGKPAAAIAIWLAVLPAMLFMNELKLLVTALGVLIVGLLTLQLSSLHLFVAECDEDTYSDSIVEEYDLLHPSSCSDKLSANLHTKQLTPTEQSQERKLLFALFIIASSIGCALSLSMGGASVVRAWISAGAKHCSVADLADLQQHDHLTFACNDGRVDLEKQVSIVNKGGVMQQSYTVYRMAPVYQGAHSKDGKPVALAVSKNDHLQEAPCSDGLCGMILPLKGSDACSDIFCITDADKTVYLELQHAISQALGTSFDDRAVPIVQLTSPTDPEGKLRHFIWGAVFYFFTLLGLIRIQADIISSLSTAASVPSETRYAALQSSSAEDEQLDEDELGE